MKEADLIDLMVNSIMEDNLAMAQFAGMSEEEARDSAERSQPTIRFMIVNIVNKLKDNNLLQNIED